MTRSPPWGHLPQQTIPNPNNLHLYGGRRDIANQHNIRLYFNVWEIAFYTRQFMTHLPGDVNSTDTSAGIGLGLAPQRFLQLGDVIVSGIDGLGKMHPGAPSLHP